jgi:hypothetical protein
MKSHAFKGLFYEKVENAGLRKHSGSFAQFFNKYLQSAVVSNSSCATTILQQLCQQPFNIAFGIWWLMNPPADNPIDISLPEKLFRDVPDQDKCLQGVKDFHDFDLYRLFGEDIGSENHDLLDYWIKQPNNKHITEFSKKVKKHDSKLEQMPELVHTLHNSVKKGKLKKDFTALFEKDHKIAKEAVFILQGLEIEDLVIDVENVLTGIHIETTRMSVIELACVLGQKDIFNYLV